MLSMNGKVVEERGRVKDDGGVGLGVRHPDIDPVNKDRFKVPCSQLTLRQSGPCALTDGSHDLCTKDLRSCRSTLFFFYGRFL